MLLVVLCCSARNKTGGLDLGEQRKRRSFSSLPCFLAGMVGGLAEGAFWSWWLRYNNKQLEGNSLCDPQEMWAEGKGGCS